MADGKIKGITVEIGGDLNPLEKAIKAANKPISAMQRELKGIETLLKMEYLPSDSIIRNQDQVVTSGSTVYPRGLIMGYVVDAGFEETGVAKFALLRAAADIDSQEQVFIITQYTNE